MVRAFHTPPTPLVLPGPLIRVGGTPGRIRRRRHPPAGPRSTAPRHSAAAAGSQGAERAIVIPQPQRLALIVQGAGERAEPAAEARGRCNAAEPSATTRYPRAGITVPSAKPKVMPPSNRQPDRSTFTESWLCNSASDPVRMHSGPRSPPPRCSSTWTDSTATTNAAEATDKSDHPVKIGCRVSAERPTLLDTKCFPLEHACAPADWEVPVLRIKELEWHRHRLRTPLQLDHLDNRQRVRSLIRNDSSAAPQPRAGAATLP